MLFDTDEEDFDDDDFDFKKEDTTASAFKIPDPSFVIIAIDTHPNMFIKTESDVDSSEKGPSRFETCLQTCYELAMNLLLAKARSWNQFAIVLTLEDQKQATLVPFHNNMIDTIKLLEEKKNLPFKQLQSDYENNHANLGEFLSNCVRNFNDIRGNFTKRTLIYITDDDNPAKGKDQRFVALNSAKLLKEHKIDVEIVSFNGDFSYELFYNEFFSVLDQKPEEKIIEDKEGLLCVISTPITNRVTSSRTYFFPIAGNLEKYLILLEESLVGECNLNCNSFRSPTGEELERGYKNFDEHGDDNISEEYVIDGSTKVSLTLEELKSCKETNYPLGYTLIGIFNRPSFDSSLHLSAPSLLKIHPKETLKQFNQMWSYSLLKDKRFICVGKKRSNDSLRYVELVPKLINNEKYFMVRKIPFCDEVEDFPNPDIEQQPTQPEVLDKLNKVMDALRIDYEPGMFSDPALLKKLNYLKSQLLGIPKEEVVDKTLNIEGIDRKLDQMVSELEAAGWDESVEEAGGAKRKAPQKATSSKKTKK